MSKLHESAIRDYPDHFADMNETLDATRAMPRLYRNMEAMFGGLVDGLSSNQAVADIGCGVGFWLYWLAGRSRRPLVGVDLSARQLELARRAVPDAELFHQDAREFLMNHPQSFGGIFCIDMLEHMESEDECFQLLCAARLALQPGGFFVCRVPNAANILGTFHRHIDITHHRIFTSYSLRQALAAAGFEDIHFVAHRSTALLGKIRLAVEYVFHRALFLMNGYSREDIYTQNVVAVGVRR